MRYKPKLVVCSSGGGGRDHFGPWLPRRKMAELVHRLEGFAVLAGVSSSKAELRALRRETKIVNENVASAADFLTARNERLRIGPVPSRHGSRLFLVSGDVQPLGGRQ